ncbi:MAG: zf-HC2 domain-containing protein [Planctomycetes bacterium]|nr:zf-HC2 domain-containing protein [Planctomycetota bacterium]
MDDARCEDVRPDLVSWIRKELAPGEEDLVRAHLETCAACRSEEAMLRGLLETFEDCTAVEPSPEFRSRVLEAHAREARRPSQRVARPEGLVLAFVLQRARKAPFLLAALAAHAAVFLVLACIYIPAQIAVQDGVEIDPRFSPPPAGRDTVEDPGGPPEPADPEDPGAVEMPPIPHPPLPSPDEEVALPGEPRPASGAGSAPAEPDFGARLGSGPSRAEVLAWFGARFDEEAKAKAAASLAGAPSRDSLRRALQWLAGAQSADGSFDPAATGGRPEFRVGVTGLALLAFLGDGNAVGRGERAEAVSRGIRYLLAVQDPESGRFGPAQGNYMYNHAIALLAVCEAFGAAVAQKPSDSAAMRLLEGPAQSGARWLMQVQRRQGGWGYFPTDPDGDTSVTGWAVAALGTAIRLGLVPSDLREKSDRALDRGAKWFRNVTDLSGTVGYRKPGEVKTGAHSLTAVSLYCRGLFIETVTPEWKGIFRKQVRIVSSRVPDAKEKADFYFWYYAAFGLHHCRVPEAAPFLARLYAVFPALQEADGGFTGNALYAEYAGRVYTTALAAMILELPYRYGR